MSGLVLASASAARARLLSNAGIRFEVHPAGVDEEAIRRNWQGEGSEAAGLAPALAAEKALAVSTLYPKQTILGCDQVLLVEGEPVGKCTGRAEAGDLLRALRGRTHELVTAAAIAVDGRPLWQHADLCRLTMRAFSDAFLEDYLDTAGDALTACVGGYAFEGAGVQLFEHVEGDFFSILGLPLLPVLGQLRRLGLAQT